MKGLEQTLERLVDLLTAKQGPTPGTADTPARAAKAWRYWVGGYNEDPDECFTVFDEGTCEMIIVRDIPFYSHCEHHLAPFFGKVSIGYIPSHGKILGLSKLNRLVNIFSRRLQVQERLTNEIAHALYQGIECTAAGVIIRARHLCMESRGVCQQGHETETRSLWGRFSANNAYRKEFLEAI